MKTHYTSPPAQNSKEYALLRIEALAAALPELQALQQAALPYEEYKRELCVRYHPQLQAFELGRTEGRYEVKLADANARHVSSHEMNALEMERNAALDRVRTAAEGTLPLEHQILAKEDGTHLARLGAEYHIVHARVRTLVAPVLANHGLETGTLQAHPGEMLNEETRRETNRQFLHALVTDLAHPPRANTGLFQQSRIQHIPQGLPAAAAKVRVVTP